MDKEWILRNYRQEYGCALMCEIPWEDSDDFLKWAFAEVDKVVEMNGLMIYNDPTNSFEDILGLIARDMQMYSLHYDEKGNIENREWWCNADKCWDDIVATYIDEHFDKLPKHKVVYVVIGEKRNLLHNGRDEVFRKEFEHAADAFYFVQRGDGRHLRYTLGLDYNPYVTAEYRSY